MALASDSNQVTQSSLRQDRRIVVGVFFVVLAVYLLTYVGAFKSNDERALFSGIDSFVKRGRFTVNQIYWDYTNVGMLTGDGEMVPNYEPGQMVLAIPFYLWGRALGAAVQGVMLFNIPITAASVALLYLCFLELRFRRRTALLGAFVYAFGTLAWPYSRTFFREPLTALAYLLAVYALLRYRPPAPRRLRWPALAGLALGVALVTKQISVALVPSLLLLAIVYERNRPVDPHPTLLPEGEGTGATLCPAGEKGGVRGQSLAGQRLAMLLAALIPLALILLTERVYHAATLGSVELFARNIVEYTTNPQLSQSVPARMWRALLGLSISPYKGLFWYSPVLLLGLVGAIPFTKHPRMGRRYRWEGLAFLLLIGGHFLGYSRYNYWSGGVAWGSRYLLPIIPFLILMAGPILEAASFTPHVSRLTLHALRLTTWLLIALSVFIQFLGVSVDLRTYELRFLLDNAQIWGGIGEAIETLYLKPAYSPVLGHLRLLLAGTEPLDFAWVQLREMGTWAFVPAGLLISLVFLAAALVAFALIWHRSGLADLIGLAMALLAVVTFSLLLSIYRQGDGRFDPYGVDRFLRPMMERLEQVDCGWSGCDEVLIVPDPVLTDYFLNYLAAPLVWYAIDAEPLETALIEQLRIHYSRIWLARDRNAETDDAEGRRGVERYLVENSYKLDEERFEDWARLLCFSATGTSPVRQALQAILGDMALAEATVGIERRPGLDGKTQPAADGVVRARPGDVLQIGLRWQALQPPEGNYTVFVQLLNADNQVLAQRDRWPGDGLFPTASLQAGQVISDNLALALPSDLPVGSYRLIGGLYRGDVEGYPRLTGPVGDFVELGQIEVQP